MNKINVAIIEDEIPAARFATFHGIRTSPSMGAYSDTGGV